jgi:putative hydrolase
LPIDCNYAVDRKGQVFSPNQPYNLKRLFTGLIRFNAIQSEGCTLIDFHTHTFFSDGELVPSELVRRATVKGYRAIGITDHADGSNLDFIIPRILRAARELNRHQLTFTIPGVELTHVPPTLIPELVQEARKLGAVLVIVHGESPVEPVAIGTNEAAIRAKVDILAHPGLITADEVRFAAENDVHLELTSRGGHSLTNGHVARLAIEHNARLVINTDTHSPSNLIDVDMAYTVLQGAGLIKTQIEAVLDNNNRLMEIMRQRL